MDNRILPVLCIDPSTNPGYALWHPERRSVVHGSWALKRKKQGVSRGSYYLQIEEKIEALLRENGLIRDRRLRFAIEAPAPNAERSADVRLLSDGWIAVLERLCELNGLVSPELVWLNSWRPYFLDRVKPRALKGQDARDWYKREVIAQCQAYGFDPKDDNAADAIGMLVWFLDGGPQGRAKKIQQEKAKKAAKKAQAKFEFA